MPNITYAQALLQAHQQLLSSDSRVFVIGLGVPTPTGVFGTTVGLQEQFGAQRVVDMPAAENGITGMVLGAAISGMRPIMVHHRVDFSVLSLEPIINQAAKWHYMYGGQGRAAITIRMVIGRGWGQGPQHSQSLQALFAHIPGIKVLMPATPADAKGMLISAVRDGAPTIILEHRWLYEITGEVPSEMYETDLTKCSVRRSGSDITLVGTSYMVLECLAAAERLETVGISAEVIDLRTVSPIDTGTIRESVAKTGRLLVTDTGHAKFGTSAEVITDVVVHLGTSLICNPTRVALPHAPTPTSPALANHYYPTARDIVNETLKMLGRGGELPPIDLGANSKTPLDIPNANFRGPY